MGRSGMGTRSLGLVAAMLGAALGAVGDPLASPDSMIKKVRKDLGFDGPRPTRRSTGKYRGSGARAGQSKGAKKQAKASRRKNRGK